MGVIILSGLTEPLLNELLSPFTLFWLKIELVFILGFPHSSPKRVSRNQEAEEYWKNKSEKCQ